MRGYFDKEGYVIISLIVSMITLGGFIMGQAIANAQKNTQSLIAHLNKPTLKTLTLEYSKYSSDCAAFKSSSNSQCFELSFKEFPMKVSVKEFYSFYTTSEFTLSTVNFQDKICIISLKTTHKNKDYKLAGPDDPSRAFKEGFCYNAESFKSSKDQ